MITKLTALQTSQERFYMVMEKIGEEHQVYRGIRVYNICLISISNSVSDGATNMSVLNIERA